MYINPPPYGVWHQLTMLYPSSPPNTHFLYSDSPRALCDFVKQESISSSLSGGIVQLSNSEIARFRDGNGDNVSMSGNIKTPTFSIVLKQRTQVMAINLASLNSQLPWPCKQHKCNTSRISHKSRICLLLISTLPRCPRNSLRGTTTTRTRSLK